MSWPKQVWRRSIGWPTRIVKFGQRGWDQMGRHCWASSCNLPALVYEKSHDSSKDNPFPAPPKIVDVIDVGWNKRSRSTNLLGFESISPQAIRDGDNIQIKDRRDTNGLWKCPWNRAGGSAALDPPYISCLPLRPTPGIISFICHFQNSV